MSQNVKYQQDFTGNWLDTNGGKVVSEMIKVNSTLTSLNLKG